MSPSSGGMQARVMDMSLRDPEAQLARAEGGAYSAGLVDPDAPMYLSEEDLYRLRTRKKLEYELIRRLDKSTIVPRQECWYLVDAVWLNKWAQFTHIPANVKQMMEEEYDLYEEELEGKSKHNKNTGTTLHGSSVHKSAHGGSGLGSSSRGKNPRGIGSSHGRVSDASIHSSQSTEMDDISVRNREENHLLYVLDEEEENEPPGPLSTADLVDENGSPLIPDLEQGKDYRGVPAISYFCFVELYGKDGSPDIPRYQVDIYKPAVPVGRLVNIQFRAKQEAKLAVAAIRPKWLNWELEEEDGDEEEESKICCCGLTKEHFETFIYWMVRCCFTSRKADGRENIKYSQYSPMGYKEGDSTRGLDSSHGSSIGGSAHSTYSTRSSSSRSAMRESMRANSSHGTGKSVSRNQRLEMGDMSSGSDHCNDNGRGKRGKAAAISPMHLGTNPDDTEYGDDYDSDGDGTGLADINYESGTWMSKTRMGAWLGNYL